MSSVIQTTSRKTWLQRFGFGLIGFLAILMLAVIGVVLWLQSGAGRDFVETRIESMEIAGQSVEIDGLDGSLLGTFSIDRLTVSGRDGVWLVANDVGVTWTPRSLLSKTLHVENLRISELDVLQRPVFISGKSGGDSAISSFDILGIDLPRITLSDQVVGQVINASASGALQHGPDGGAAQLSAQSDQGDLIETNLTWSSQLVLSGTADIDGVPGGLIAALLQLNPDQGVAANVTTQGDRTNILAEIAGTDFADVTINRDQSSIAIDGRIDLNVVPFLDNVAPIFGGTAEFDTVLPLDEHTLARFELRSPRVTLDASGTRSDKTLSLNQFSLNVSNPLETFDLDGVGIGQLAADGRVYIGETYRFEGQIDARNLSYRDYAVDRLFGPTTLTFVDSLLGFNAAMSGAVSNPNLARANGAKLIAKGELDITRRALTLAQADINLPGLAVRGRGEIEYGENRAFSFNGRYDIDTAVFRDGPSAKLSGRAVIEQTANGPVVQLSGQATRIENLTAAVLTLVPNGVDYAARLRMQDGQVIVPRFTASRDNVSASGSARWADGRLTSDIEFSVPRYDYAAISAQTINGTAQLFGPLGQLGFQSNVQMAQLAAGGMQLSETNLSAQGTYGDGAVSLEGMMSGESPYGALNMTANLAASDGNWAVTDLDSVLGGLMTTGSVSGYGSDISMIKADLIVAGTTDLISSESIEGRIVFADSQVDIEATLNGLNAAQLSDTAVHIVANGPRNAVAFQIDAEGNSLVSDIVRPMILTATGLSDLSNDAFATQADIDVSLGGLGLVADASVEREENGWRVTLAATGLGGVINVDLNPDDGRGVSFDLDCLSVPQLSRLLARPATEGSISGEGRFAIVEDKVEGTAGIRFENLRSPISDSAPITLGSDIKLANERLSVIVVANEGGLSGQATIDGNVETLPRLPFLVYPPSVPLQGTADMNGEIGPIVELFLPPQTDVAGIINTELSFTVPHMPDRLQGQIDLSNGSFDQGALGLKLTDITMKAVMSNETVSVSEFSARGDGGGTLNGSGQMGLGEGTGTVDIRAEKLRVLSRREGQAEVSGELNLSRTAELLRLGGNLRVTDADINIARLPKPGLPTLEIDFGETDAEVDPRGLASTVTELDIRVVSDGRIKVTGRGLNTSMNLNAKVQGSFDAPVVTGDMSIDRGRFDFLSKRFEFRESSVVLREDILQSRLSLEAVRETSELTALVAITGTLERPEIKLSSEPNLPEDEVLSRILFGRSPTQLTAIETARLAAAISQLSGGGGFDLFGSLENAIGLDTLEIGQNVAGQTQLTTGKYLSDDVYLEVRTAAEGTPSVAVEWQVRENVSVEAETLPNEGQRLSVQWKKDFD